MSLVDKEAMRSSHGRISESLRAWNKANSAKKLSDATQAAQAAATTAVAAGQVYIYIAAVLMNVIVMTFYRISWCLILILARTKKPPARFRKPLRLSIPRPVSSLLPLMMSRKSKIYDYTANIFAGF